MDGARGWAAAGLAMVPSRMLRRARHGNGEERESFKRHATPLHLLRTRLWRLKPPILGSYRETRDQWLFRTPMASGSPQQGPLLSGFARLHKRYIILGDRGRTQTLESGRGMVGVSPQLASKARGPISWLRTPRGSAPPGVIYHLIYQGGR